MSAATVSLPANVAATATRAPAGARSEAANGEPAGPDSPFGRLIASGDAGSAGKTGEASRGGSRPASARPADAAQDHPAADAPAAPAAGGDGNAVLAWLQQAANPAAAATVQPTPAADGGRATAPPGAAPTAGESPLARLLPAVAAPALAKPDSATPPGPASPLRVSAGAAETEASAPIFKLAALAAGRGEDGGKAIAAGLEQLLAAAVANGASGNAASAADPAGNAQAALAALAGPGTTSPLPAHSLAGAAISAGDALAAALAQPLAADSPELPRQLGERVQWLVGAGVQEARLQLHPRDLGAVSVQVRVESGTASVWFSAEHPAARAALQAALPQLREQFAGSGVALAQAQVSADSGGWGFGGSAGSQARTPGGRGGFALDGATDDGPTSASGVALPRIVHLGLLDDYA